MEDYGALSDHDLVAFLKEGREAAFGEIYNRYWSVLFLHARHMMHRDEEARDIVQDLFTGLWQKAAELDLNVSLSSYLYRAVRNKVLDHIKHQRVMNDYLKSMNRFIEEGTLESDALIREKELAAIIEESIQALPSKMRTVFELSRKQHLSYLEISHVLGISEHTVKSQISNALQILRDKIGPSVVFIYMWNHIS